MSKKYKLIPLLLVMVLVSTMIFTACEKSPNQKVRLMEVTHSLFYTPQYVALTQGFFEEEGLDVELITGGGADKVMTAMLSRRRGAGRHLCDEQHRGG